MSRYGIGVLFLAFAVLQAALLQVWLYLAVGFVVGVLGGAWLPMRSRPPYFSRTTTTRGLTVLASLVAALVATLLLRLFDAQMLELLGVPVCAAIGGFGVLVAWCLPQRMLRP